jgi:hypothetical protein
LRRLSHETPQGDFLMEGSAADRVSSVDAAGRRPFLRRYIMTIKKGIRKNGPNRQQQIKQP